MPVISTFYGIVIRLNHGDHPPPHVHAEYSGYRALVGIRDGTILRGHLPRTAAGIVRDWCLANQDAPLTAWNLASRYEPFERIPGADHD